MDHRELSKYSSYQKLIKFFADPDNISIWTTFARFVSEISNFSDNNDSLLDYIQQQELDIKGKTQAKNNAFLTMTTLAVNDSKKAYTWAVDNGDADNMKIFHITTSDMKKQPEAITYAQVKNIRDIINTNITSMSTVELLPGNVVELDKTIKNYEDCLGLIGVAQENKQSSTKGISDIMKPMDVSLDLIDRLIVAEYGTTNPDMVKVYLGCRELDALPTHHSGIKAHIVDNITGNNLEGVTMTLEKKSVVSNISGLVQIIKTKWGTFNVTFSRSDYVPQTMIIVITRGKLTDVEVSMKIKISV